MRLHCKPLLSKLAEGVRDGRRKHGQNTSGRSPAWDRLVEQKRYVNGPCCPD